MGKIILVTGGARSGKSSFAENMARKLGDFILYVATSIAFDEEMKLRIKKHREQRPEQWETLEAYKDMDINLKDKLEGKSGIMLDCITIMLTNIMLEENLDWNSLQSAEILELEKKVNDEIYKLIDVINSSNKTFILVTNEVGMGIVPENALSRVFRDMAGRVNQLLAKAADEVYFCVSGIPMKIK